MRVRLLATVSLLVLVAVVGLGLPLATLVAARATSEVFTDRLADTSRFAALAQRAVGDGDPGALTDELARYDQVYGISASVVDRQGLVLDASRPTIAPPPDPRVRFALLGQRSDPPATVYPWTTSPMLLAEPVLVDGEVRGAVLVVSPTGPLAHHVAEQWALLVLGGLAALVLGVVVCLPLVRWILAPVDQLETGTAQVEAAVAAGSTPEPVGNDRGPPELRRLSRRFDQMAAGVAHALDAQRAFVADAGHQLRNPLTALRLRLQTVGDEIADLPGDRAVDPAARERLVVEQATVLEETDRFGAVLDELLALARAEGRPTVRTRVEVDALLDERVETWSVLAGQQGRRLVRTGPGGSARPLVVESDPGLVVVVLDALLDNALKYAPPEAVTEVGAHGADGHVELVVRDHGPGLGPEELARATGRFWRGPSHRGVGGSGLGLAIAARAAERSGGSLRLESPDDGGLRAVLRLPVT